MAAIVTASRVRRPVARNRSTTGPEAVAGSANGLDGGRTARQRQLPPQVADVDADNVGPRIVLVAPDGAQDLLLRYDAIGVADEEGEEVELPRRQARFGPPAGDPPLDQVN